MTDIQERFLTPKRKVLNNDRIIEAFALSCLTEILLGNDILLFKINYNITETFLHIDKIKVI